MAEDVIYNSIVAATVSIIVTAIAEFIVNRTEERRSKRVYKNSLKMEVENNLELIMKVRDNLSSSNSDKQSEVDKLTLILYTSVFDSMVSSGNLSLLDEREQKRLQEVYSIIKQNNEYVKIYTTIKHLHLPSYNNNNYSADGTSSSSDVSQMEQWIEHNHSRIAKMLLALINDIKHRSNKFNNHDRSKDAN
jgi:hypothetical protein